MNLKVIKQTSSASKPFTLVPVCSSPTQEKNYYRDLIRTNVSNPRVDQHNAEQLQDNLHVPNQIFARYYLFYWPQSVMHS